MPPTVEVSETIGIHHSRHIDEEEIARDLALMDEMEAFAQSLPKRTEGRDATAREIREMAYEEREAGIL